MDINPTVQYQATLITGSGPSEARRDLLFGGPLDLLKFIQENRLSASLPNSVVRLRIFLTVAPSVACCEKSFSNLILIKYHLRSTMTASRLNKLAILSIRHQLTEDIDFSELIRGFAEEEVRKVSG